MNIDEYNSYYYTYSDMDTFEPDAEDAFGTISTQFPERPYDREEELEDESS